MSKLSDSLFAAVQKDQGYGFISDGLDDYADADVIAVARGALLHSRRVVRILEKWLAKYDDGSPRRLVGAGSGRAARPGKRQRVEIL